MSQSEPSGNTKEHLAPNKGNQLYNWFFTVKKEEFTPIELWEILSQKSKKFTFQLEMGKGENAYEHYQGVFSLKIKERFSTVKNILCKTAHIEPASNYFKSMAYCSKEDTRIDGPWTESRRPLKLITELRDWQKSLVDELKEEPNDRKIIWYYDEKGCSGKTVLCKYLVAKMDANVLTGGTVKDIAYCIGDYPKIVLFNFSRTKEGFVSYDAIEGVKDGMITSPKYESRTKIFDPPHVVIFANWMPKLDTISKDKWEIRVM